MQKLFMVMLGCTPKGRLTEQHDVFFGIAKKIEDLVEDLRTFWPVSDLHIDCWRTIEYLDGYKIDIVPRTEISSSEKQLYFINLGGYLPTVFEELHEKIIVVAQTKAEAIKKAKTTTFYKDNSFKEESHIDDQYGIDIDDIFNIEEVLPSKFKEKYRIQITETDKIYQNNQKIGYIKLSKLK